MLQASKFAMSMAWVTSLSVAKPRPSMRFRAAAWLAALALLVILVQSLALVWVLDTMEEEFIERQLSAQIAHSMALWQKSPDAALPNAPDMWLYRINLSPERRKGDDVPPLFADLPVGNHEVYLGSKEYHVAVRMDDIARYILAYDVEEHESRLGKLMFITIGTAILLGLFTLWAGYLIAGRLTLRLGRLARRVEQGEPGALAETDMDRELFAVAEALDHSRQRQQAVLERERDFAANMAHEIRTPLTGIRTDAEMLLALPNLPEAVSRRGNRIVGSVDRINALANSLLWLAREARPANLEEIGLKSGLAAVWNSLTLSTPKAVALRLDVPAGSTVKADAALFELVLRNVLDNALRYSEAGEIVCRLSGSLLVVVDCGSGFPEADLERVFDRFFIGPRGTNGLGLALVRHVCTASGWQVCAANAPAGGGEIRLDFGSSLIRN